MIVRVILFVVILGAVWFLYDLFVPFPQIGQLCADIIFIGRQCVTDPISLATYPQRVLEWWIQKIIVVVVTIIIGVVILLFGTGKRSR